MVCGDSRNVVVVLVDEGINIGNVVVGVVVIVVCRLPRLLNNLVDSGGVSSGSVVVLGVGEDVGGRLFGSP